MIRSILPIVASLLLLASCAPSPYYQEVDTIPQNAWASQYRPHFKFEITDTASYYDMYFIVRHTEAYPYSNIWMWISVKRPGDSAFTRTRIEVPLAAPSGQWLGRGMGEIWEQRMSVSLGAQKPFSRKGTYEMFLEQDMRVERLPDILNVGLRVEKGGNKGLGGR